MPGLRARSWRMNFGRISCRGMKWLNLCIWKLALKDRLEEGDTESRELTSRDAARSIQQEMGSQTEEVGLGTWGRHREHPVDQALLAQYPFFQSYFKWCITKQRGKSLALPIFSCSLINFIQVHINWQLSLEDINSVSEVLVLELARSLVLELVSARPHHSPGESSVTASSLCESWVPHL